MTILPVVTLIFLGLILMVRRIGACAWKGMLTSVALLLSIMISTPASARPFVPLGLDGPRFYAGPIFSGPVTENVTQPIRLGANWDVPACSFRETEKVIGVNDKIDIFGTGTRHRVGPDPGEVGNVNTFRLTPDINIQAGVGGAVPGRIVVQPIAEIVEHKGTVNNVEVIHFYQQPGVEQAVLHQPPFRSQQRQPGVHVEVKPAIRVDVFPDQRRQGGVFARHKCPLHVSKIASTELGKFRGFGLTTPDPFSRRKLSLTSKFNRNLTFSITTFSVDPSTIV